VIGADGQNKKKKPGGVETLQGIGKERRTEEKTRSYERLRAKRMKKPGDRTQLVMAVGREGKRNSQGNKKTRGIKSSRLDT